MGLMLGSGRGGFKRTVQRAAGFRFVRTSPFTSGVSPLFVRTRRQLGSARRGPPSLRRRAVGGLVSGDDFAAAPAACWCVESCRVALAEHVQRYQVELTPRLHMQMSGPVGIRSATPMPPMTTRAHAVVNTTATVVVRSLVVSGTGQRIRTVITMAIPVKKNAPMVAVVNGKTRV